MGVMENSAIFILGDGVLATSRISSDTRTDKKDVYVMDIDGVSEFARLLSSCGKVAKPCTAYLKGTTSRAATELEIDKLAGNEEAVKKARAVFLKWINEKQKSINALRMRFSVRREILSILVHYDGVISFDPIIEILEKRFQTKVHIRFVSPREISRAIGGVGICGRVLCCSSDICRSTSIDTRLTKQQFGNLYDFSASGVCGKLKCCIGFEQNELQQVKDSDRE
jgi:cell fate regulator YaaT (PSP1 superfamily)